MIDCPNGEMRDRLPDLVHDQLSARVRAEVEAHVAGCTACTAEVALLRRLRATLGATPGVDVSRIVAALPAPRRSAAETAGVAGAGWERFNWRVAAAVVALAVGGGSVVVWSRTNPGSGPPPETRVASTSVSIDADLAEASVAELDALLRDLESFDGLPAGDPEPMLPEPGGSEVQR